uniref:Granulin b n=1 Tax=Labrus bergylta TaxID=56723 RepID=A0A3Q3EXI5_9LABR
QAALTAAVRFPAFPLLTENSRCDKSTSCPGKATCCKTAGGGWACCPLPQAVCCSDREHCCPKGYRCNVAEQTCDKPGALSLPWLQKIPALHTENKDDADVPCDTMGVYHCPGRDTCCRISDTEWACCPSPSSEIQMLEF